MAGSGRCRILGPTSGSKVNILASRSRKAADTFTRPAHQSPSSDYSEISHKPGPLEVSGGDVRDIHEVYRMFGEMICRTHMVHMGSLNAKPVIFASSLRLVSRVNYGGSHIDCSSQDTIHLCGYVRPSQVMKLSTEPDFGSPR